MENKKGKYSHRIQQNYCVLDLETTGLDPKANSIIEIAILRIRNGKIKDEYSVLVNPKVHIAPAISSLTGITNEMVVNSPYIEDVIDQALDFLGTDLIVGHNTNFDIKFLAKHRSIENKYVDTFQFARKLYPELEHHRLSDLQEYLGLSKNSHRAMADCVTTYELYETIKAKMKQEGLNCGDLWPESDAAIEFYKNRARKRRALKEASETFAQSRAVIIPPIPSEEKKVIMTVSDIPPVPPAKHIKTKNPLRFPRVFITLFDSIRRKRD